MGADAKYIHNISCGSTAKCSNYIDNNGSYNPQQIPTKTYPNDLAKCWAVQLTVKYMF